MFTALLIALITFVVNSLFLTLYFSALILDTSSRLTLHRDALKITFPGTILLSVFVFLTPLMPPSMLWGPLSSSIDIGVTAAAIIWFVLTKRYCETSWLSAIMTTAVAVLMCTIATFFIDKFLLLLISY